MYQQFRTSFIFLKLVILEYELVVLQIDTSYYMHQPSRTSFLFLKLVILTMSTMAKP